MAICGGRLFGGRPRCAGDLRGPSLMRSPTLRQRLRGSTEFRCAKPCRIIQGSVPCAGCTHSDSELGPRNSSDLGAPPLALVAGTLHCACYWHARRSAGAVSKRSSSLRRVLRGPSPRRSPPLRKRLRHMPMPLRCGGTPSFCGVGAVALNTR